MIIVSVHKKTLILGVKRPIQAPSAASRGLGGTQKPICVIRGDMLCTLNMVICLFIPILLTIHIEKCEKYHFWPNEPPFRRPWAPLGWGPNLKSGLNFQGRFVSCLIVGHLGFKVD